MNGCTSPREPIVTIVMCMLRGAFATDENDIAFHKKHDVVRERTFVRFEEIGREVHDGELLLCLALSLLLLPVGAPEASDDVVRLVAGRELREEELRAHCESQVHATWLSNGTFKRGENVCRMA